MKADKTFDCVGMKNAIQTKIREEKEQLGEAEVIRRHRLWLETSDAPLACWWRSLSQGRLPRRTADQSHSHVVE